MSVAVGGLIEAKLNAKISQSVPTLLPLPQLATVQPTTKDTTMKLSLTKLAIGVAMEYPLVKCYVDICEQCEQQFGLPEHVDYYGIREGLHEGECQHSQHSDLID